ncbi:MAG: hypothetical protein WBF88_15765 [Pusillimonas sp.]
MSCPNAAARMGRELHYHDAMSAWYILPNGNIKHIDGLELQPEKDWFPTAQSMETFTQAMRERGQADALIIKRMMDLAVEGEQWVRDNLA